MIFFFLACFPTTPKKPTSSLEVDLHSLTQQVGLAAQDSEHLCEAITTARALRPSVQEALTAGKLNETALAEVPGLVLRGSDVHVDWPELSQAIGQGPTSAALITIGGVESIIHRPCMDVSKLSHWVSRTSSFKDAPACVQKLLSNQLKELMIHASTAPCVCSAPPETALKQINSRLDELGINTDQKISWPTTWPVCATEP